MSHDSPETAGAQAPALAKAALASQVARAKQALFGHIGAQGFLPHALTLMQGQPTPENLEEAEELLILASLEARRWRRSLVEVTP